MGFQDVPAEGTMPEEAPPAMEGFCGSSPAMTMLIVAAVFVAFTPGIMLRVGQGYGKYAVATIHGVVVALILSYMFGPAAIEGFAARTIKIKGGLTQAQMAGIQSGSSSGLSRRR
jgi:hypothetical protein